MKSDLLNDLLPPPEGMPPAALRQLLRREKRRQTRARQLTGAAAVLMLVLAASLFLPRPQEKELPAVAKSKPLEMEKINDEQLVQLFGDQPVALVQWPGQDREYVVLWKRSFTPPTATGNPDPRAGRIPGG